MRFLTAGESHGKGLTVILEGVPANLDIDGAVVRDEMNRRRSGFGRGPRMRLEEDAVEFLSGVRFGKTTGAPIAMFIKNGEYEKVWSDLMSPLGAKKEGRELTAVRPGHADLAGAVKYAQSDARNILERASARETAARVAVGAVCRIFLAELGICAGSHVIGIGGENSDADAGDIRTLNARADADPVRCLDKRASARMIKLIEAAKESGDTLGGRIRAAASGVPVGIGSHIQFDKRLDYLLAALVMSVQAVKCVAIGDGAGADALKGSEFHDRMYLKNGKIVRETNRAGGIEGGISNGENIVVEAVIKPIPSLASPLETVDIATMTSAAAAAERSDVCAVPAAGVVCEAMLCYGLSAAILETSGGDHMDEVRERIAKKREAAL
ncbi:MAG: chorismate synthase [Clostridiales bacterium]|nr:chorismate synthase [Clostridiales bacterium]